MTANEVVEGLMPWLTTVAGKFANRSKHMDREDFVQEGALAILAAGAEDEPLAKVIALRAMMKFRDRGGPVRVVKKGRVTFCPISHHSAEVQGIMGKPEEPEGVFWDNLANAVCPSELDALRRWVESDDSADEIGRQVGVAGRTMRLRLQRACEKIRERWGVEGGGALPKRMTKLET